MSAAQGASVPAAIRPWVSCADDFAIDAGAVDAIVELMADGRITATSVLADAPLWASAARQLPAAPVVDVGLHLNLTQSFRAGTRGTWPLVELLWRSATRQLAPSLLQAAIARQFDAFETQRGRPPDYIDGHQHVHQFAMVREALIEELQRRYTGHRPWIRSTRPPAGIGRGKALGIALLGDRTLRRRATAAGLPTSGTLVGVYDFAAKGAADRAVYRARMGQWLRGGPAGCVLMCHPAVRAAAGDPIGAARVMEYDFLRSAEFGAALDEARVALVPGSGLFASAGA